MVMFGHCTSLLGAFHMNKLRDSLEIIEVSNSMRDLIHRRTKWIGKDFVNFNRSLETALANAYVAGMNDAIDVLYINTQKSSALLAKLGE